MADLSDPNTNRWSSNDLLTQSMLSLLRLLFTLLVCLQLSQVVLYRTFYVAAAATFIVALLVASTHKSALRGMKSRIFHLTALIGYFAVTSLWSLSPSGTLLNALYAAIWIPVFISAVVVFRTTSLASCIKLLAYVPFVVAGVFIYALATYGSLRPEFAPQVGSLCNLASMLLVGYLPILVCRTYRFAHSRLRGVPAGLCALLLAISQSRSGLLIGGLTLAVSVVIFSGEPLRTCYRILKTLIIVTACLALLYMNDTAAQQIDYALKRLTQEDYSWSAIQAVGQTDTDLTRKRNIIGGIEVVKQHYVLGIGYMAFEEYTGQVYNEQVSQHSIYLALLGETGLVGAFLFGSLVWRFYRSCRRAALAHPAQENRAFAKSLMLGMSALLLFGLFGQVHQSIVCFHLLAWGLALRTPRRSFLPNKVAVQQSIERAMANY